MNLWYQFDRPLILASTSPRRRDILRQLGLEFLVNAPDITDESSYLTGGVEQGLMRLAEAKAHTVARQQPHALVLGADTVVMVNDQVLGKPVSRENAVTMLTQLSGRRHDVYTAVALVCASAGYAQAVLERTTVWFRAIGQAEIERYLHWNEYNDKAGAYAIQGRALAFIDKIEGCYYNVMGLPVSRTIELFTGFASRKELSDVRTS